MSHIGHELLYSIVKAHLKDQSDALVTVLHWNMIFNGFKCVGSGEEPSSAKTVGSELLPDAWNSTEGIYNLLYRNITSEIHLLKIIKMNNSCLVHLMRLNDELTGSLTIKVKDYVNSDLSVFQSSFKNISELNRLFQSEIMVKFKPAQKSSGGSVEVADPNSHKNTVSHADDDSLRVGAPSLGKHPNHGRDSEKPFAFGHTDLDPLSNPHQGGMIFDPNRIEPQSFPDPQNPRLPNYIPRGSIPPGARFDPIHPGPSHNPDLSRAGPDPDHLPPPGFDDMFM